MSRVVKFFLIWCLFGITSSYASTNSIDIIFAGGQDNSGDVPVHNFRITSMYRNCTGIGGYDHNGMVERSIVPSSIFNNVRGYALKYQIFFEGSYKWSSAICKTDTDDKMFFTLQDFSFAFNYKGKDYECKIPGRIGLSYYTPNLSDSYLRADREDQFIYCSINNTGYKIINASIFNNRNYIQMYLDNNNVPKENGDNQARINIYSNNDGITDYNFADLKLDGCSGSRYRIARYLQGAVDIEGAFNGDGRNDCKLPIDNVYFKIKNPMINFKYRGEAKQCLMMDTEIGTSYDHLNMMYNKLQSHIQDNPFGSRFLKETAAPCVGSPGFFYKIHQGTLQGENGYSAGWVELSRSDVTKQSALPATWVLFINGINNNLDSAMQSSLRVDEVGPTATDKTLIYGLLYNRSNGFLNDAMDLNKMKEFDYKLAREEYVKLYENSFKTSCNNNQDCKNKAYDWYISLAYTEAGCKQLGLTPELIFGHDFDSIWTNFINYGVEKTDKIIFVAHSQGNLYANVMQNYLSAKKGYSKENMNTIHVGVTSSLLSSNLTSVNDFYKQNKSFPIKDYITLKGDSVINFWRFISAEGDGKGTATGIVLPGNVENAGSFYDPTHTNDSHGFLHAYLNDKNSAHEFLNSLYKISYYDQIKLSPYDKEKNDSSGLFVYSIFNDDPMFYACAPSTPLFESMSIVSCFGLAGFEFTSDADNKTRTIINKTDIIKDSDLFTLKMYNPGKTMLKLEMNRPQGTYKFDVSPCEFCLSGANPNMYVMIAKKPYYTAWCGFDTFTVTINAGSGPDKIVCGSTGVSHTLYRVGNKIDVTIASNSNLTPLSLVKPELNLHNVVPFGSASSTIVLRSNPLEKIQTVELYEDGRDKKLLSLVKSEAFKRDGDIVYYDNYFSSQEFSSMSTNQKYKLVVTYTDLKRQTFTKEFNFVAAGTTPIVPETQTSMTPLISKNKSLFFDNYFMKFDEEYQWNDTHDLRSKYFRLKEYSYTSSQPIWTSTCSIIENKFKKGMYFYDLASISPSYLQDFKEKINAPRRGAMMFSYYDGDYNKDIRDYVYGVTSYFVVRDATSLKLYLNNDGSIAMYNGSTLLNKDARDELFNSNCQ